MAGVNRVMFPWFNFSVYTSKVDGPFTILSRHTNEPPLSYVIETGEMAAGASLSHYVLREVTVPSSEMSTYDLPAKGVLANDMKINLRVQLISDHRANYYIYFDANNNDICHCFDFPYTMELFALNTLSLSNPNIQAFFDYYVEQEANSDRNIPAKIYVMSLATSQSLHDIIETEATVMRAQLGRGEDAIAGACRPRTTRCWSRQIANGLKYIHDSVSLALHT